ncbi:MAG: SDR family NAD(P)-dependent oxidoreductase [Pseudomonadota bacterium]
MSYLDSYRNDQSLAIAIVGSSGGIGRAMCDLLLADDLPIQLYLCARSQQQQPETNSVQHLHVDYSHPDSIQQAAEQIKNSGVNLDVLIVTTGILHNDRGLFPEKSVSQLSADHFIQTMQVNALGPALVAQQFLPLLNKQKRCFFGAISARVGSISDNRLGGWYSYRASKAALNMLLKTLAIEYQRKLPKTIIAGLHPGTVATQLSSPFQKNVPQKKLFDADYSADCLLKVIDQLSSDHSGQCFAWDGSPVPP